MKKSLLVSLFAACSVALASAMPTIPGAKVNNSPLPVQEQSFSEMLGKTNLVTRRAMPKAETKETVLSETPSGTLYDNMYVTSYSIGMGWGAFYNQDVDGGLGAVVEGDDGCLYVRGPISQAYVWGLGYPWMKLEKSEGNIYTMKGHQLYAIDAGDYYYMEVLAFDDALGTFVVHPTRTDIKFEWKDNTLTWVDTDLTAAIGLCDAYGEWFYMADWDFIYSVCPDTVATVPASAQKLSAKMSYNDNCDDLSSRATTMVDVYVDGMNVYIDHLNPENVTAPVVGTIGADGKITIPGKQYLGINTMYNNHIYALAANAKVETGSSGTYFNFDITDSISATASADMSQFTVDYPQSLVVNGGKSAIYYLEAYIAPILNVQEDLAMTPADPSFHSISYGSSYCSMKVSIPALDVNGAELNTNLLSYQLYLDDEPYTFTTDKYIGFTTDMTEIPYGFADSYYDIYNSSSTGLTTIYFYELDWKRLGLQTIYRGGGEERRSNIVYLDNTSAVESIDAAQEVSSVQYFDLSGRILDAPTKGFVIKRVQFTNGKVEISKTRL